MWIVPCPKASHSRPYDLVNCAVQEAGSPEIASANRDRRVKPLGLGVQAVHFGKVLLLRS